MNSKIDHRLYLVTDDPDRYRGNWLDNIVAAVEGGVTCVQYRDTKSEPREKYARLRALQDALRGRVSGIIVNNDVDLAVAVKAEGLHVGQSDTSVEVAREIVGPDCEIGLSITEKSQLANLRGADLVGVGPVFDARHTKVDAAEAMGVEGLKEIVEELARECPLESVAIGGINLSNAEKVLNTGVGGLAVVSAFSQSENPYETARKFTMLFDHRGV